MLLSRVQSIEDFIIEKLSVADETAFSLWEKYCIRKKDVTIQAVYKELRKLQKEEIVTKHKEVYSLNAVWKSRVIDLLQKKKSFPILREGESIVYSFRSLDQLDNYWKHIHEAAEESASVTYLYGGHQFWWSIPEIRESEIRFYKSFSKQKRKAVLLLGATTQADKDLKKILTDKYVSVHTASDHPFSMSDSCTVQNDLIVQTRLSYADTNRVNYIYNKNLPLPETEKLLCELFKRKIPAKIIIERNAKKAERLKKQIGKYFF
jgi:hypothetical protein